MESDVDAVTQFNDRSTHRRIELRERRTTGTQVRARRVDLAQRLHEGGEIDSRLIQVVDRAVGVVAEPIDVVIGPVRRDRLDRQIGPVRELTGEQVTQQGNR